MSSLFPPREPAVPEPGDWELNRSRVEMRFIGGCEPTDPEQAGFPSARQVASLTRLVLRKDKTSKETVHLITSLEESKASGKDLKKIKRDYWAIESKLHYRLDNVLDEDRSRVRNPNAALVLGMFRRVVVSFAIPWSLEKRKPTNAPRPATSWSISTPTTTAAPSSSSPPRPQPHGKIRKNQPCPAGRKCDLAKVRFGIAAPMSSG